MDKVTLLKERVVKFRELLKRHELQDTNAMLGGLKCQVQHRFNDINQSKSDHMTKFNFLILLAFLCLGACTMKKPFQPAPATFTIWKKAGVSTEEVKKAMLECGFISPYTSHGMTEDSYAKAQLCMVKNGYLSSAEYGIFCDQREYKTRLPACVGHQK